MLKSLLFRRGRMIWDFKVACGAFSAQVRRCTIGLDGAFIAGGAVPQYRKTIALKKACRHFLRHPPSYLSTNTTEIRPLVERATDNDPTLQSLISRNCQSDRQTDRQTHRETDI